MICPLCKIQMNEYLIVDDIIRKCPQCGYEQ